MIAPPAFAEPAEESPVTLETIEVPESALEVGEATQTILSAIAEMDSEAADLDAVSQLSDYIEETKAAYDALTTEEQESLSGSMEMLANAEVAVDVQVGALEYAESGDATCLVETEGENSWRYINGMPIEEAQSAVEEEVVQIEEEAVIQEEEPLDEAEMSEPAPDIPQGELMRFVATGEDVTILTANGSEVYDGIDVSHWQGDINWDALKKSGEVDFVIIRCGHGVSNSCNDRKWTRNVAACERLGIPYGVYFYSEATTLEEVDQEAAYTLKMLKGHKPQLPVFYDMEDYRMAGLSKEEIDAQIHRYCKQIMNAGYKTGIYANLNWFRNRIGTSKNDPNYFIWVAQYPKDLSVTTQTSYTGRYNAWQYSSKGSVTGISGNVDMNKWYGKLTAIVPTTFPEGTMFRLYNPNSSEHFYTASVGEANHLYSVGWNYEGVGWRAPTKGDPVYRLYNPNAGDHHYTTSAAERDYLVKVGWNYEGVGWYSASAKRGKPLYRLYNPNAKTGSHHYTLSAGERDHLKKLGWRDEGVGWYGVS